MTPSQTRKRAPRVPKYCHHKATGQAYLRLNGSDHYLGKFGTPESQQKYAVLIAEHSAGAILERGRGVTGNTGMTVVELLNAFMKHAQVHYLKDGKLTAEFDCIKSAIRPVLKLYGDIRANDFGPLASKACRQQAIDGGTMCRDFINKSIGRIRRGFRFGV